MRSWIDSFGIETEPFQYPNLTRAAYAWDSGDGHAAQDPLAATEEMLSFLSMERKSGVGPGGTMVALDQNNAAWAAHAERCSRAGLTEVPFNEDVEAVCRGHAAIWAALGQWSEDPYDKRADAFAAAVSRLGEPS